MSELEGKTKSEEDAILGTASQRRHDVDWLRTLALGLLIIYHSVVSFQPWAVWISFIQNPQPLRWLWVPMSMINVWRIPILFVVSGMGVRFAMKRRDWKELLKDRTVRILIPFIFGFFFICPISAYLSARYYSGVGTYIPNSGHLWFLANIFIYVLLLLPLFVYLKRDPNNFFFHLLKKVIQSPYGIYIFALPLIAEAWLVNPDNFSSYTNTPHGFWLGMICFFIGFIFISIKEDFWPATKGNRRGALAVGLLLYLIRVMVFEIDHAPNALIAVESTSWMVAIWGYGSVYLNKPSDMLVYLRNAVYPVYIIHLPLQFGISYFLMPLPLPAILKLVVLITGTLGLSLFIYEYALRRLRWVRPLFGMKFRYN